MQRAVARRSNLWLANALWKLGAIEFGDFTLGRTAVNSPIYINPRLLVSNPSALRRAAHVVLDEIVALQSMRNPQVAPFDLVAGVPFGGLHLATSYSLTARVPMIYLHPRKDSSGSDIEGRYSPNQTALIIDDLITGGSTILETALLLAEAGLRVKDAVVLVDRQEGGRERLREQGINLISVLTLEVMVNYLMSSRKISEEWYRRCLHYLKEDRPSPDR
jgi:orotate phosphoribosyltransferase